MPYRKPYNSINNHMKGNRRITPPTPQERHLYQAIIAGEETTYSASKKLKKGYANTALIMWHIALQELRTND
jgi:hypothetical protein